MCSDRTVLITFNMRNDICHNKDQKTASAQYVELFFSREEHSNAYIYRIMISRKHVHLTEEYFGTSCVRIKQTNNFCEPMKAYFNKDA